MVSYSLILAFEVMEGIFDSDSDTCLCDVFGGKQKTG
jgi:hypothetical protein